MSDLSRAERYLRRDDKALRLRQSMEGPNILVERKTKRGRIGAIGPEGLVWRPDAGRRYEEGHVLVLSVPTDAFNVRVLRESLQAADTWKTPDWIREMERKDDAQKANRIKTRKDNMRYKASELFDRYVWKYRQRVAGGL
jgi:hypothetical protein